MAASSPPVDTRQGGLQRCAEPVRRWQGAVPAGRVARPSEADLAAPSTRLGSGERGAVRVPPAVPEGSNRWAGPGASWPASRAGSHPAEQFAMVPPSRRTAAAAQVPDADAACIAGPRVYVVWHKHTDLRLHDHEPLSRAHLESPRLPVVHLHVFDPFWFGRTRMGKFRKTGALRAAFWRECVADLRASLRARGQDLCVRHGMPVGEALQQLAQSVQVVKAFTYAEVCSEELEQEAEFEAALWQVTKGKGELVRCWGYTLHHIDDLQHGPSPPEKWITPYLSFGAFKKEISAYRVRPVGFEWQARVASGGSVVMSPPPALDKPAWWGEVPTLVALGFTAEEASAAEVLEPRTQYPWRGGESAALARLEEYIWGRRALRVYVGTTDWSTSGKCSATRDQTTKLSPYLAFGCLSPRLLYWEAQQFDRTQRCKGTRGLINSLLWRDFYRFIVHYAWGNRMFHLYGPMNCGSVPGGHKEPTKWCCKHYNNLFGGSDPRLWSWGRDRETLRSWAEGTTGYPFVDAAMLELRATGYMQHLSRETVGWFFVRDLRLDWRLAAEWFESRLVDYDCVLNWGNWVYFILTQLPARMDDRPGGGPRYTLPLYSPYLMASQVLGWGSEHDPTAAYVKRWLPQLGHLPPALAREPWRLFADSEPELKLSAVAGDSATEFWACTACTLENPAARSVCEACGTRGPRCGGLAAAASGLGVYGRPPIVPPPPEESGLHGSCLACGHVSLGWAGEDGRFFCGACWAGWTAEEPMVEGLAAVHSCEGPVALQRADRAHARALPPLALPAAVATSGLREPGAELAAAALRTPIQGERKRGARWAVRGNRSGVAEAAVGA
uniref:Cryptochrome DASH n=1 Tax=Lingulaulax polyedra TaxID=160621 RepID=A0A516AGC3_LINPO|nr:cryptochrome DASH [Lingulodinium polyedra]